MKDQITKGLRFLSAKSLGLLHRKETAALLAAGSQLPAANCLRLSTAPPPAA
jgi:hypothetical protein